MEKIIENIIPLTTAIFFIIGGICFFIDLYKTLIEPNYEYEAWKKEQENKLPPYSSDG